AGRARRPRRGEGRRGGEEGARMTRRWGGANSSRSAGLPAAAARMTVQHVDSERGMALAHRRGVIEATAAATRTGMLLMLACSRAHILFAKAGFALDRQTVALFDLDFIEPCASRSRSAAAAAVRSTHPFDQTVLRKLLNGITRGTTRHSVGGKGATASAIPHHLENR